MSFCKHGIDPDQLDCAQCHTEHEKSRAYTNGSTRAADATLREHFAAMAMQGMMASEAPDVEYKAYQVASRAVELADALIAALAKPVTP